MLAVFLFCYVVIGGAAGWATWFLGGLDPILSIGVTAVIILGLSQVHLFATRGRGAAEDLKDRMDGVEEDARQHARRLDVVEARTDAVETTVKHELTERRDALVAEMKQLERLIERLSLSFEARVKAQNTEPVSAAEDDMLRAVKDALEEGRVELHLQPIVSLPQRRVAFYEGYTRLRSTSGEMILPSAFLEGARRAQLLGAIDNMTLFRCVQIVRRLAARDRRVGVFCNIAAASLQDDTFFPHFLEFMAENRDLAGALIFEIRADRFETRSRKMRDNMDKLTALGFRFSIDHAGDIGLDLARLQDAGVRFVKVPGDVLLDNLRTPSGPRPICSIQRQLDGEDVSAVYARYGVTLIAEKMEDEASIVEILEYDIPFGQGHVFGAPRPIKASLMEETAPPAEFLNRVGAFG